MQVNVTYYSICRDAAGTPRSTEIFPAGTRLAELLRALYARHPKLADLQKSLRTAVGVDYQTGEYLLRDGDEVALLPPMQGG